VKFHAALERTTGRIIQGSFRSKKPRLFLPAKPWALFAHLMVFHNCTYVGAEVTLVVKWFLVDQNLGLSFSDMHGMGS